MKKNSVRLRFLFVLVAILFSTSSLLAVEQKLKVIATLFPLYDFAKNIGQDKVAVSLLLPPGVEAHSFEPKPQDIVRISEADVFIYTGKFMEPWAEHILTGIAAKKLKVIDTSQKLTLLKDERVRGVDPHIWLDFTNAKKMVDDICAGFVQKDLANESFYLSNAEAYKKKLDKLDEQYSRALANCRHRIFIHGGHFAFGYLAKRYNLIYISAYKGFTPDAEPTAKDLVALVEKVRRYKVSYIYYEELINPRVAEVVSREARVKLLKLSAAHNISKEDLRQNVSFLSIMESNLVNLKKGLECQEK